MKTFKNFNGAFGVAALLLSAMAFTACSSDDIANVNPTFDGESVKTQFAINIPHSGQKQGTRMGATETQEDNGFLGMYDIRLIPLTALGSATSTFAEIVPLTNISATKPSDLDNDSWADEKGFRKIYNDVNVAVGTTNFLFYGAGGTSAPSTVENKFTNGILDATVSGTSTSGISFALRQVNKDAGTDSEATQLKTVLDAVAKVAGWNDATTPTMLGDLHKQFVKLKAGSTNTIMRTLQNLYKSVDELANSADGTDGKTIAQAIQEAIKTNDYFIAAADGTLSTTHALYPNNINMPDGSVILKYKVATKEFVYVENTGGLVSGNPGIKKDEVCYPASIYYFVNTDLVATNNATVTWPANLTNWPSGFAGAGWGNSVLASTRTIALKQPIQYGVGKLAMNIQCASNALEDNAAFSVTVPEAGFPVKAVLVGGQPVKSNWDFNPNGAAATWTRIVYDKNIASDVVAKVGSASPDNYTLVMDNSIFAAGGARDVVANQQAVTVAIELENNSGYNFAGQDGIIYAGSKFYLLATLTPTEGTGGPSNPSVFMQDYITRAKLTIKSLKNAYNVIPDLRATQLKLGLAVDLEWKAGLSFDITIQ